MFPSKIYISFNQSKSKFPFTISSLRALYYQNMAKTKALANQPQTNSHE